MRAIKQIFSTAMAVATLFAFSNCSSDDDNGGNADGTSRVKVRMTDAPGDYEQVNIEVIDVKIKANAESGEDGWISIGGVTPQIYNLLDLTGGVTVLLADNEIPSGHLGQIRLILGENNTVVKNGQTYELNTPSAQQSGLKLQVNQTLEADLVYEFLIDFDVDASVVEAGNSGNYNLHPVLRVTTEASTGSIRGLVVPGPYQVVASIVANGQTISAYANDLGQFVLHGVPQGTYTLTINVESGLGLGPVSVQNIAVVNGQVTDVGNISL